MAFGSVGGAGLGASGTCWGGTSARFGGALPGSNTTNSPAFTAAATFAFARCSASCSRAIFCRSAARSTPPLVCTSSARVNTPGVGRNGTATSGGATTHGFTYTAE